MARVIVDEKQITKQVVETVKIEIEQNPDGTDVVYKNNTAIAGDDDNIIAAYSKILLKNSLTDKKIAILGGGTLILPRMMANGDFSSCDIFELEQSIMDWALAKYPLSEKFNTVIGDYRETISDSYDIIIFDISDDQLDEELLIGHLTDGGKLVITYRPESL